MLWKMEISLDLSFKAEFRWNILYHNSALDISRSFLFAEMIKTPHSFPVGARL